MRQLNEILERIDTLKERIEDLSYLAIEAEGSKLRKIEARLEQYEDELQELSLQADDMSTHMDIAYDSLS